MFSSAEKQSAGMQEGPILSGSNGIRDSWKSMFILPKCGVNATVVSHKWTKIDDLDENSTSPSEQQMVTYI